MRRRNIVLAAIVFILFSVWVLALSEYAGDTDPTNPPGATSSYTLEDIYNRLNDGTAGSQSTFTEPTAGPVTSTMHTLNEIMGKAPAMDNSNGATASEVLSGKTFWGLTSGEWGPKTGTAAAGSDVLGPEGSLAFPIPDGIYSGKTATAQDGDLAAGNIKSGVNIFGIDGDPNVVNTSSGDATAGDILSGKKAWVDGSELTGSMAKGSNVSGPEGSRTFSIPNGFYSGKTATANDADLIADNIKNGKNIFNVSGNLHGGCTCEGTMNGTRWCDNGDGTVTDLTTCLVWLKKADWGGEKPWEDCTNHDDAQRCVGVLCPDSLDAGLSDGSVVGDWRLPTKTELYALAEGTEPVCSGTPRAFTGVYPGIYWSSTTYWSLPEFAWGVNLDCDPFLREFVYNKGNLLSVWPVRGGQ
ncbi:MAG: DUF1566 domain-containing protein [Gemmatimonadota bacterium]|nr:MAG: DUF1566 domain-containing protein [Gemmatimonadota bacterium]